MVFTTEGILGSGCRKLARVGYMYISIYVCMYVCMLYVCMYASMYVCMYVCMYVSMYGCRDISAYGGICRECVHWGNYVVSNPMMDTSKSDIFWKNIKLSLSLSFLGGNVISVNRTDPTPGPNNGM